MKVERFAQKVVEQFCRELTDQMFLYIENDKNLMKEYLHLVSDEKLENVNKLLGSEFKKKFFVDNCGDNNSPKSKLIDYYTEHTVPKK